MTTASAVWGTN